MLCLHVGIDFFAQLLRSGHEGFGFAVDGGFVVAFQRFFDLFHCRFDGFFFSCIEFVAVLGQAFLDAVDSGIGLVARLNDFKFFLVFGGIQLGVFDHLLNFIFAQTRVGFDGDFVFFAGGFVFGADVQDAVGVNVKRHFNLRSAARCGSNAFQVELAQALVAAGHFALALVDLDGHGGLVVFGGRESLCKLGRDGGVFGDHLGHHAAQGFDAQRQRCDVEQQHVGTVARQHLTLNGSAHGHGFVRVDVAAGFFPKEFFDLVLHLGHTGHAADQDHVVNVAHRHASVFDGGAARRNGALDQLFDQLLQLGAVEFDVQVFGACRVGRDVGQIDVGGGGRRQLDLGFFSGFFEALQGQHVFGQIDARLFLELANDEVDDALVKVFAAQKGVAVGGEHFELFFAIDIGNLDDGDVKRAAA